MSEELIKRLAIFVDHFKFADDSKRGEAMSLLTELATLQSIKDAGDDVVEPDEVKTAREFADPDSVVHACVKHIDHLQSALQVAQQERDEKRLQWQNWRSRMGLTASATELLERAEKAESEREQFRKDAERYVEWRSAFRNGECALYNALCDAQTDSEHDAAIDSARNK